MANENNKNEQEELQKKLKNLKSLYQYLDETEGSKSSGSSSSGTSPVQLLNGRKVRIPLTSKAFFQGTLQPTTTTTTTTTTAKAKAANTNKKEEQVLVNVGKGYMAEMTRSEACDYINKRMDQVKQLVGTSTSSTALDTHALNNEEDTKKKKKKKDSGFQMKKGFLNKSHSNSASKKKSSATNNNTNSMNSILKTNKKNSPKKMISETISALPVNTQQQQQQDMMPILPYIEIREEYDKNGVEIKAEALNVSNELVDLKRKLQSKITIKPGGPQNQESKYSEEEKEKNEIVDTLLQHLPMDDMATGSKNNHGSDDNGDESKIQTEEIMNPISTTTTSEPRRSYKEISSRLDELILLEEEAERKKANDIKSSKQLRGKGWAKGFLDNKNTHKNSKDAQTRKQKNNQVSTESVTKASTTTASLANNNLTIGMDNMTIDKKLSDTMMAAKMTKSIPSQNKTMPSRKVQFKSSNQVKEIPRIGTKSYANLTKPNNNNRNSIQNIPIVQPEQKIFQRETVPIRGVVERQNTSKGRNTTSVSTNANTNADTNSEEKQESVQPTRKLSRFAQRRRQREM